MQDWGGVKRSRCVDSGTCGLTKLSAPPSIQHHDKLRYLCDLPELRLRPVLLQLANVRTHMPRPRTCTLLVAAPLGIGYG